MASGSRALSLRARSASSRLRKAICKKTQTSADRRRLTRLIVSPDCTRGGKFRIISQGAKSAEVAGLPGAVALPARDTCAGPPRETLPPNPPDTVCYTEFVQQALP